jgi:hypothetical protein
MTAKWVVLLLMMLALWVACSGSEPGVGQAVPTPTQVVEYGASLSEWEEAVGSSSSQTGSADNASLLPSAATLTPEATPTLSLAVPTVASAPVQRLITVTEDGYWELMWDDLVPADFRPEAIMAKYQDELSQFQDGDPEAMAVYMQMQQEFNNAPVNEELDDKPVKLPGFIAPLEYEGDVITEFLLVPYFGACIHVPPPPVNQTVLITAAEDEGILIEDSFQPVWVYGVLSAEKSTTDLAEAGYFIEDAVIEPYSQ